MSLSNVECRKRVAETPGAILLESAAGEGGEHGRSIFFEKALRWIRVSTLDDLPQAFVEIERALEQGLWVAGYFAYECGFHWEPTAAPGFIAEDGLPLAWLGVYKTPLTVQTEKHHGPERGLPQIQLSLDPEAFGQRFRRVQACIAAGDTYQVNLTCTAGAVCSQPPEVLFAHMMARQPVRFGAMLHVEGRQILSASPELFFSLEGRHIVVRPMKGTARRGEDVEEDDQLAAALATDEKNRAENVMIVDLLRSDLGRIAETGSVRAKHLFKVERHPSLLQMTSEVQATLRPEVGLYDLFRAIFPSGSIVGAPKVRTMQILRTLEDKDRGVYTGAIGYISPTREAVFSVAIRTAVLEAGRLSMGVGAGITASSEEAGEYAECQLKAEFLRDRSFSLLESMRWQGGRCELLPLHLDRVQNSAAHVGFVFCREEAEAAVRRYVAFLEPEVVWKVRLALDRQGACSLTATRVEDAGKAPQHVMLWPVPVLSGDGWLRHKTTYRERYDEAHKEATRAGCLDALFCNERGMLTEGAIHSVFVRHGSRWRTPPLSAGILSGVYRRHMLALRPEIREEDVPVAELWTADEILLTNAVRGVRSVALRQQTA